MKHRIEILCEKAEKLKKRVLKKEQSQVEEYNRIWIEVEDKEICFVSNGKYTYLQSCT